MHVGKRRLFIQRLILMDLWVVRLWNYLLLLLPSNIVLVIYVSDENKINNKATTIIETIIFLF